MAAGLQETPVHTVAEAAFVRSFTHTHTDTRTHYFPLSSDEMVECMVEFS